MSRPAGRDGEQLYTVLTRVLLLAAGIIIALWILYEIRLGLLILLGSVILGMVLNRPIRILERHGMPRWGGFLLILLGTLVVLGGIGYLVVPRLIHDLELLAENIPTYVDSLNSHLSSLFGSSAALQDRLHVGGQSLADSLPSLPNLLTRVGRYSLTFLETLALIVILFSLAAYIAILPRSILANYVLVFPPRLRPPAIRAYTRSAQMVVGWFWSNLVIGAGEAVVVGLFLWLMGIPGAIVWASLAFFAELIPKFGAYIMAIPPLLVAISIDPLLGVWVVLFYIFLNEFKDNVVLPRIRSQTMDVHPAALLFAALALAYAFGLYGVLLAHPVTGIVKAYYEEFYLDRQPPEPDLDATVEEMLEGES